MAKKKEEPKFRNVALLPEDPCLVVKIFAICAPDAMFPPAIHDRAIPEHVLFVVLVVSAVLAFCVHIFLASDFLLYPSRGPQRTRANGHQSSRSCHGSLFDQYTIMLAYDPGVYPTLHPLSMPVCGRFFP